MTVVSEEGSVMCQEMWLWYVEVTCTSETTVTNHRVYKLSRTGTLQTELLPL
jgi:hypothetical protein